MYEIIHQTLNPSQIAVSKASVRAFLEHKGWNSQTTSDNKEYWSRNKGQLMTLEAAFELALEADLPKVRKTQ